MKEDVISEGGTKKRVRTYSDGTTQFKWVVEQSTQGANS